MRLSNRNKASVYNFVNTLLVLILIAGIGAFFIERFKFNFLGWKSYLLLILPMLLLGLVYKMGRQIFEYDSDGEALNFKNRNIIPFLDTAASDEFPKYKLMKFEIVNIPLIKRLYITISSKKGSPTILKYDISYLTKKETNDLKFSLNKIVKNNKENKEDNNKDKWQTNISKKKIV